MKMGIRDQRPDDGAAAEGCATTVDVADQVSAGTMGHAAAAGANADHATTSAEARQRIAVFDFDGTILEGQSPVMLVKSLLKSHAMPPSTVASVTWWGVRYKLRLPHEQYEVRKQIFQLFKDMTVEETDRVMEYLYDTEISTHLRPDALEALHTYQELGVEVIIVSASFEAIVGYAARKLGAAGQISTKMKSVDHHYTGEVGSIPVEGLEKREALERYADQRYGRGGWELVAAYGDHHTDVPLLEIARRPVAVTPDTRLHRIARARGWEIVYWS